MSHSVRVVLRDRLSIPGGPAFVAGERCSLAPALAEYLIARSRAVLDEADPAASPASALSPEDSMIKHIIEPPAHKQVRHAAQKRPRVQ